MKYVYILVASALILFGTTSANAQMTQAPYGLGLRADPDGAGISGKYYFCDHVNFEAMLNGSSGSHSYGYRSTVFVGMAEYNISISSQAWHIYIGPGIHIGSEKKSHHEYGDVTDSKHGIFGFDVIGGVEYSCKYVPVGIALDVKPGFNLDGGMTTFPNNLFGLGIRYYFGNWASIGFRPEPIMSGR